MAAAEYFYSGGGQSHPSGPQPPPPPQSQNPPYPLSDAPPPYTAFAESRPHSQPPPQQRPPPHDDIYRPAPQPNGYGPDKSSRPPPQVYNMSRPQDFGGPYPPQQQQQYPYPPQQQGYFPPPGQAPAMQQVYRDDRKHASTQGYAPSASPYKDESRSRSRSRSRTRHRRHHRLPPVQRKKSSGVNTFLGAGGGAILGDAIFPGLGTIGGALLGGLGGHEYGKKRTQSNPNRTRHRSYSNDFDYYNDDNRRGRKY